MVTLTCPRNIFLRLMIDLRGAERDTERVAYLRVGSHHQPGGVEWLVCDYSVLGPADSAPGGGSFFRAAAVSSPPPAPVMHWPSPFLPSPVLGHLYLGQGAWQGQAWSFFRSSEGTVLPVQRLKLPGTGMFSLPMMQGILEETVPQPGNGPPPQQWSRTIGALGGEAVWRRLISLRFAQIGAGRNGSLMARNLTGIGVRQLSVIDPDRLELHNLGEMHGVHEDDIGEFKAQTLARNDAGIHPIVASLTDRAALDAVRASEVICCCADNDAARLAAAVLANLYLKVLLDIGTGIFYPVAPGQTPTSGEPHRVMGADVRLIIPGDGCLLCRGGLTALSQAVEDLSSHRPPQLIADGGRPERAGSLRSLNEIAVGVGMQMLQDLVASRISRSTWARVEFDDSGTMAIRYESPDPLGAGGCALCARAGMGDEGFR